MGKHILTEQTYFGIQYKATTMASNRNKRLFFIQSYRGTGSVFQLVKAAAAHVEVEALDLSGIALSPTETALNALNRAIFSADIIVADVSDGNENVLFEVGMATASRKPLLLIASSIRNVPSDLTGLLVLIYDVARPDEFIARLGQEIRMALRDPNAFTERERGKRDKAQPNVFVSYSHHDTTYLERLLVHLRPLEKQGHLDLWVDTRLRAGDRWKKEIDKALHRATVAVLLVSADFLASDFITDNELPPLLRSAEERGTRIVL